MHTPSHFAESRQDVLLRLIAHYPVATLVTNTDEGIQADHVPMLFDGSVGSSGALNGHVARANPVWQKVEDGTDVLVIFHRPNHYVSPSWYPSKEAHGRVVPTWNYALVHVRGALEWRHERHWLRRLLEKTTNAFEAPRPQPWHLSDAPPRSTRGGCSRESSVSRSRCVR